MTNVEKYEKWLEMAEDDLDTASVMLKSGKYMYVSFMCQQAIEKLCKGIYVTLLIRKHLLHITLMSY